MVLFRVRIHLDPGRRAQVRGSLIRILEWTRALPGCLGCELSADVEDEDVLVLVEEWQTQAHLEARLRHDSLRVVLAALDCAVDSPRVRFETVGETKGIELVAACRMDQTPG
jgi:quinol monooxygenase YgiN